MGLVGPDDDICIAKAILDLTTMRPIGYINIVYEREYFGDIVRDNSTEYSGACYVVDRGWGDHSHETMKDTWEMNFLLR